MPALKCKLLCHSVSPHVQQLYTGFNMLAQNGLLDVTQNICRYDRKYLKGARKFYDAAHAHLRVEMVDEIGRKLMLYFDNHDAKEINESHLSSCDVYFKRSYSCEYVLKYHSESKNKIFPLGLNYKVLPDKISIHALQRSMFVSDSVVRKVRSAIESIDAKNFLTFHPRLRELHSSPLLSLEPKVLFMATVYDPDDGDVRLKEEKEERIYNNEFRAACVRVLRKELGNDFYGGFVYSGFAKEKYSDVLIDNPVNTIKRNYLKILEKYPICVATTGLHGSIGWKFAEYVAFSKAILTEKLQYEVPGEFFPNKNYLVFNSPEDCVEKAFKLMNDHEFRTRMMMRNFEYYRRYVMPDMLILNALSVAMEK